MRFEIRPLVRPIRLRDYAEEYGDETIWVWVNLPRKLRLVHAEIVRDFDVVVEARKELAERLVDESELDEQDEKAVAEHGEKLDDLGRRLYEWFAVVWSEHEDEETHWTADEVGEMVDACLDADPRLWTWVQEEHWRLVNEHRDGVKKK